MTLRTVQRHIRRLATIIDAPARLLPTVDTPDHDARPHIEIDARGLHWVIYERGQEHERHTFQDLDGLLRQVFSAVTFTMGCDDELENRTPLADGRRRIWARQLYLLEQLSPEWATAERRRIAETLESHPFDDRATLRMRIARNLRQSGVDADAAWDRACELIPLPEAG